MKTVATILAVASVAAAVPVLDSRQAPAAAGPIVIQPTLSIYNGLTSSLSYDTSYGQVSRTPGVNGDISTLFTFNIPSTYSANNCQVTFSTAQSGAQVTGTGQAQIFTSLKAAAPGAMSNSRNQQIGNLQAVQGGPGTFTGLFSTGNGQVVTIPCSKLISQPSLELAPVGERDNITWQKGEGLLVSVLPQ